MRLMKAVEGGGENGWCGRLGANEEGADGRKVGLDEGVGLDLAVGGDLLELWTRREDVKAAFARVQLSRGLTCVLATLLRKVLGCPRRETKRSRQVHSSRPCGIESLMQTRRQHS